MERSLQQLRHLQNEIDLLKERLKRLENTVVTDVVTGSWPNFPYIEQRQRITGVPLDAPATAMRSRLKAKMTELVHEQERATAWILAINDSEMRQIFMLRYIENCTWQQVAMKMGSAGDGSTERKKHNRFIELSRVS